MSARTVRGLSGLVARATRTPVLQPRASGSNSSHYRYFASSTDPEATKRLKARGEIPAIAEEKKPDDKPKPLSRPLGSTEKPVSSMKTYKRESRGFFADAERNKEERRVLMKEASRGYYHDYNVARKGAGGKAWIAPSVLIREDRALYFPNIAGTTLTSEKTCTTDLFKGKTSLVSILTTQLSAEHAESFVKHVLRDQENTPDFQYIQINHQQNYLKAALVSISLSSIRRDVPEHLWSTYILNRGEWSELDINEPLGIDNKILGYVFLVDGNCKVRWAGCGLATDEEEKGLRTATEMLVRRAQKAKAELEAGTR